MPRTTLTLRRSGTFEVTNVGDHWCGTSKKQNVKYDVEVICGVSLDERGFLFDQLAVQKFFDQRTECAESCEQFTIRCARELYKVIKQEHKSCDVRTIRLSLSPAPYAASMTFEFAA